MEFEFGSEAENPAAPRTFAVSGLLKARGDLLVCMAGIEAQRRALRRQIEALEVSLRVLDPDVAIPAEQGLKVWRGRPGLALHGLTLGVMKALRLADGALTNSEVSEAVMSDMGHDPTDRHFRSIIKQRVGVCLRKLRLRGLIKRLESGPIPKWAVCE